MNVLKIFGEYLLQICEVVCVCVLLLFLAVFAPKHVGLALIGNEQKAKKKAKSKKRAK